MSKTISKVAIFNCDTQTEELRNMNEEELLQLKELQDKEKIRESEVKTKTTAKAALLERLGITAEEAALLLG
jgi:hypothetical protein